MSLHNYPPQFDKLYGLWLYLILDGRKIVFGGVILFKKLFVTLTVITLSTLTSFPTFATTLSNSTGEKIYEFKYNEFKENINSVEKLNENIESASKERTVADNTNIDISTTNTDVSDTTTDSSSDSNNPGYISSFIMESTAYTGGTITDGSTATVLIPPSFLTGGTPVAVIVPPV